MDVHTQRLRHFLVVAEELHFTRAASRLYLSQQALSRSISALEDQVEVQLLIRTTRSVALTQAGEVFLHGARATLEALRSAGEEARAANGVIAGRLRVGFTVISALELTGPVLREFAERFPAVKMDLIPYQWSDPSCGLGSGATDVAFIRLPIACPDLSVEPFLLEPRAIGIHRSHELAGETSVTLDDLVDQQIMAPATDDAAWSEFWTLRDTGADESRLPRADRTAGSMEEELAMVSAGLAITTTAISMARFTPRPSLVFRPIEGIPQSEIAVCWRGAGSRLTEAFRQVVAEVRDREYDLVTRIACATGQAREF
ncbi:LysR family transcriptional regulator [Nocardioides sp.]|uniref:LysR family transcriptional regulator n=1 Tax=Nocardioides sp. TaxID=35761 RepID=UPI003D0A2CAC